MYCGALDEAAGTNEGASEVSFGWKLLAPTLRVGSDALPMDGVKELALSFRFEEPPCAVF